MDKREILELLEDWNFWRKELDTGTERQSYTTKCLRFLKANTITAIIGARRSGKSYIMRQTIKKLMEKGIGSKNVLMVNFEDQRFTEFYPKLLDQVYEAYMEFLKPDQKPYILLDEVQNVPGWERWVRTVVELGKAKVIVSGSSSKLLTGELASVLTGRHLDIFVFPLSFKEFLGFKNLQIKSELDIASKKTEIKIAFKEYMEFGGFPEAVLNPHEEDKKQLLLTYFDDILTKDVEKRYKLKETGKLRTLARFYLANTSSTVTFNSLKKFLNTTTNTIQKFSTYFEEVNLLFFVKRFSFKIKEQEKAARKVYAIDAGLANSVGFKFSSNFGRILENLTAIELKKREKLEPNTELYYWQDQQKKEVDFVIKKLQRVEQLIQVCWNPEEYETKEREVKAMLKASDELKCTNLLILTEDFEREEKTNNKTIRYVPLWKWLLKV